MPVLATIAAITAVFYATSSDDEDTVPVPYSLSGSAKIMRRAIAELSLTSLML